MIQEYVIDFECDVYTGRFFGGRGRQVATVFGAAITTDSPEWSEECYGGLDPKDVIDEAALRYAGVSSPCYTVTHLRCWNHGYIDRNSPIWHKCTWSNP